MTQHSIHNQASLFAQANSLEDAVTIAEALLEATAEKGLATYTIRNSEERLVAAVTNRRIQGVFTKQEWGGRKGDDAIKVEDVPFDATNEVLTLSLENLLKLQDNEYSSDDLGRLHVEWDGPHEVRVVESIKAYFGVDDLEDITPEVFEFVKNRMNPKNASFNTVTLVLRVKSRVSPGADIEEFVNNLNYTIASNTPGVVVQDTELVESY
ncbi:hypothetical protein LC612_31830 [Nostoc sp. CHAB 5834]|nr:hypothetical protein [Nostoc sp. CHAB 5834]